MTDRAVLRQALISEATSMANGMLRHLDEDQVMEDLKPSIVELQPDALASARRSMTLARRTEFRVASEFVSGAIPKTVASIEKQLPQVFDFCLAEADRAPVTKVAGAVSDLVVSSTMLVLLPVFELAAKENPSTEIDDRKILGAIRLYIDTADHLSAEWGRLRSALEPQGLEWSPLNADHLAGKGLREQLQLVLPNDELFEFVDSRVHRGGDAGGAEELEASRVFGILRTAGGEYITWAGGRRQGRFSSLEAAFTQVRQLSDRG